MKDERKTKRQLIDELIQLRQQLSQERCQLSQERLDLVETPSRVDELETRNQDGDIRRRMEELLQASVEQWYTIFNTMNDAICLLDPQNRIQRCNRAMVKLAGKPLGEILGHYCWEVVHGTCAPIDDCPVVQMQKSLSRKSLVMSFGDRWFDVSADLLLADDGRNIGAVHVMKDITELKQVEEELRESEERYRALVENLNDVIYSGSADGTITYVSPSVESILGYTPADLVGKHFAEFIHPDDLDAIHRAFEDVLQNHLYPSEYRMLAKDGEYRWISTSSRPVYKEESVVGLQGVLTDITERKQAEKALREAELRYRTVADFTFDWEDWENPDGTFRYVSPACERITGYATKRFMDEPGLLSQLILPQDRKIWAKHQRDTAETPGLHEVQFRIRRSDGEIRWVEHACQPVTDQLGAFLGYRGSNRDITERKQAEEERSANVHFLECMDRVNRAIQGTNDLEQMMSDVLDEVLSIFDCDRAWFVYPCDPQATTWQAPMERTRPEYPGAFALKLEMPVDSQVVRVYKAVLASDNPVGFGPGNEQPLPADVAKKFNEQSQLAMAVYPKVDKPYMFGIHQCSRPRAWTPEERRLLKEIGTRLADSLTSLLVYRNLKERENKYRELANSITDVFFAMDADLKYTYWNRASENLTGVKAEDAIGKTIFEVFPDTKETRKAAAVYQDVLKKKQAESFETEYRLEDKLRFFEINAYHAEDGIAVFVKDITERKQIEQDHLAHLRFLESMDQINRAMQSANDPEQMLSNVLDVVQDIFDCDRSVLVYPCDPEAATWQAPIERSRSGYPGILELEQVVPTDPEVAEIFRVLLKSSGPVRFGPESEYSLVSDAEERFSNKSFLGMALYPRVGSPWQFGIHQCSYPRVWTPQEERLFQEIGRRLTDGLNSLLMFRSLRESEGKLAEAQRIAHVGYWERDINTGCITCSDETYRIFGLRPQERILSLAQLEELLHPEDQQNMVQAVAEALRGGPRYDVEYRVIRPNGEVRFVHSWGDTIWDKSGRPLRMFGVVQDITERRQVEEALAEQAKQLRFLSARLADAQEVERRRIARELHDQVGQNLTVLGINLNTLRPHLAQAPEEAQSCLNDSLGLVKQTTGRIRDVMADLRPPELDDYGLLSALHWYADHIGARTGLAVTVEGESIHPRLTSQQATALFRIAQEALTNVVKHAQVTQATVTLEANEERVRMIIADNGVGFDPTSLETTNETPHWGLLTMRERAQAVGAQWRVEPDLDEGTRIVVELARPEGKQQ